MTLLGGKNLRKIESLSVNIGLICVLGRAKFGANSTRASKTLLVTIYTRGKIVNPATSGDGIAHERASEHRLANYIDTNWG